MNNGSKFSTGKIMEFSDELIQISSETKILIEKYNSLLEKVNTAWTDREQEFLRSYASDILKGMDSLADMCQNYGNNLAEYNKVKF